MITVAPPIERLLNTPVLRSEMPAGFDRAKVSFLSPDPRYHTLGAVRVDFVSRGTTESVSFALFKNQTQASAFARTARNVNTGGLFRTQVAVVGRIVISAAAATRTKASALITFGLEHLRRSEH
jgi:hypothetical protein